MATPSYDIKPKLSKKFKPNVVKELMRSVLVDKLQGEQYMPDNAAARTRDIADEIKNKLKVLEMDRYKIAVQVLVGEQRGEGARMGCRCFWDADSDNYVQEIYTNEHLFCVAVAFGVYYY